MKKLLMPVLLSLLSALPGTVRATGWRKDNTELIELNRKLKGKVLDYTANHGHDNRIWSRALGQRRDLYVYLPPNFDPRERYPICIFLHGLGQDEQVMLDLAPMIDHSIYVGDLPPLIVAAPDGSVRGEPDYHQPGTFFLNSNLGDFEDFVLNDVWDFMAMTFPLRSEREAHVLAGISMGGFAAFNFGLKHRYCFGTVIGIHPPLNLRWMDDCGNYMAKFNPYHWGWRTNFDRPGEVVGRFGLSSVRVNQLIKPLFASSERPSSRSAATIRSNWSKGPCLRNGELQMYVGYAAHDEFNVTAQVESFLYLCKFKRIYVGVGYDADGHHDLRTAYRFWPGIVTWLKTRLETVELPEKRLCEPTMVARSSLPRVQRVLANSPAPPVLPAKTTASLQPLPQPLATYWSPPHLTPGQPSTGAVSRPEPGPVLPEMLPEAGSVSTTPGRSAPIPPPPSRADLGPPARSAFPYGPYDNAQPK